MILYFATTLFLFYVLHNYIHGQKKAKFINRIPGPRMLPVFGNAFDFICSATALFYKARALSNTYTMDHIYRTWALAEPTINLVDPEDFEVVLSSSKYITKSKLYDFLRPWLNEGLLTSTGEKWHARRKILTPAFHFNILRQFCTIFRDESEKLVKQLKSEVDKEETDILPFVTSFTLYSICETAMGINLDTVQNNESEVYKKGIREMSDAFIKRLVRVWLHSPYMFAMSTIGKLQQRTVEMLHKFTSAVISERRSLRTATSMENHFPDVEKLDEVDMKKSKRRLAMLDLLLSAEAEGKIDAHGIREEVDTFMFEGHDTTTMAITFCLMELANNSDIQENVFQELSEIYKEDNCMTIETLNKMEYLEKCIKEALRLYPSVTMLGRRITEDMQLRKFFIPAGTTCHLHVFDLHRRADLYPNPTKFDPDRFSKENSLKRHPFAYVPFSAGPRNCIGQKFAMLEVKAIISSVILNYKLKPITRPDDLVFTADLILKTKYPVKVKFINRV